MSQRSANPASVFAGAAFVGLVGGWLLARGHDSAHRNDLFSCSAWRRFGALGWLERNGDVASIPVLHDYLSWESHGVLRARAQRVITSLESDNQ